MGWLYTVGQSRKVLIDARTKAWGHDEVTLDFIREHGDGNVPPNVNPKDYRLEAECLKRCFKGCAWKGTLWTVWEHRAVNKMTSDVVASYRYIGCDLLAYSKRDDGWGYKDMDESMGPAVYNCPLSYLKLVPCPGGYATDWRESVHAYHGYRGPLQVGERVELRGCLIPWVTVACVKPLRGRGADGTIYKLQRKQIVGVCQTETV